MNAKARKCAVLESASTPLASQRRPLNDAQLQQCCTDVEAGKNKKEPFSRRYLDFVSGPLETIQCHDGGLLDVSLASSLNRVDEKAIQIQAKIKVSAHWLEPDH